MSLTIFVILSIISGFHGLEQELSSAGSRYFMNEDTRTEETKTLLRLNASNRENWIRQPLDHYKPDSRTWLMRYFKELRFFKKNGPIYLFINGEQTAKDNIDSLLMNQLARETGGAMFASEHRYYGESNPYKYYGTYQYLSSQQALADLAYLIKYIKSSSPDFMYSKVIVIGGSYPGNLAAWMKELYPDLVYAGIASSAPVLAKKDFYEYIEHVGKMYYKYGGQGCYNKIEQIFNRYEMLLQSNEGIEILKREENYYQDLRTPEGQHNFLFYKVDTYMGIVQLNGTAGIIRHCQQLLSPYSLTHYSSYYNNKNTYFFRAYDMSEADRSAWMYQICSEFGYIFTSYHGTHPFTKRIRLDLNIKAYCTSRFGAQFDENRIDRGVAWTNSMYGGLRPKVSKVVFVYGEVDPWGTLGIKYNLSEDVPVIKIPGSTHCNDLWYIQNNDPNTYLTKAKYQIINIVKQWLFA